MTPLEAFKAWFDRLPDQQQEQVAVAILFAVPGKGGPHLDQLQTWADDANREGHPQLAAAFEQAMTSRSTRGLLAVDRNRSTCTTRGTLRRTMAKRSIRRLRLDTDIKPVLEFRANAADLIEQVRTSGRPLVLTQRGHSAAVVLDVAEYEHMVDEIDVLRDIHTAAKQIDAGRGVSNREAKAELRKRFTR